MSDVRAIGGIRPDGAGSLRLAGIGPLSLGWSAGNLGGLAPPPWMALDGGGDLYVLEASASWRIKRFDPMSGGFAPLPGVGGAGSEARRFQRPQSIAIGGAR